MKEKTMKHYLALVQISAKHHRKQNWMTRLCIVLAVFLVTVIGGYGDADADGAGCEKLRKMACRIFGG